MDYLDYCLTKFRELPERIRLSVSDDSAMEALEKISQKYNLDLNFLVILVTIGELTVDDIEEYLKIKYKINQAEATNLKDELVSNIFIPATMKVVRSDSNKDTVDSDKDFVLSIFRNDLAYILNNNDIFIVENINVKIFNCLEYLPNFKKELEEALYSSEEELTKQTFILDNKELKPTIGNWIKDFLSVKGSGPFDSFVVTNYLIESVNCKKLTTEEKEAVINLLKLYYNLRFFPNSLANLPLEDWEIIPEVEEDEEFKKEKTVENNNLNDLMVELEKYPVGSLERMAIEEEISNLKKA